MAATLKQNVTWIRVKRYWELLSILVERNLKARYRGSILGVYWSLLNPLLMTGIYTAIFGGVFVEYYDDSILNYILAAFTGLAIMHFFAGSTSQALRSVLSNSSLLNKIALPVSIFPVSTVGANIFQFVIGSLPLLAIMAFFTSGSPINSLALFLPMLALVLVCMGTGFLLATLFVFFRDLPYFYQLVIYALRIATPVFYPADIVPLRVRHFLELNPLASIIESVRQITLSGDAPDLSMIWSALWSGAIILILGWLCFQAFRDRFMDLL